jgi:hypothetical protein
MAMCEYGGCRNIATNTIECVGNYCQGHIGIMIVRIARKEGDA